MAATQLQPNTPLSIVKDCRLTTLTIFTQYFHNSFFYLFFIFLLSISLILLCKIGYQKIFKLEKKKEELFRLNIESQTQKQTDFLKLIILSPFFTIQHCQILFFSLKIHLYFCIIYFLM